ncbi:MAG TPA: rhomboid family intramembrane serine protease [Rhizomicrobium sp.]
MAAKSSFGQRSAERQMSLATQPVAFEVAPALPQAAAAELPSRIHGNDADIPMVTIGLIAVLTLIFWAELNVASDFTAPLTPSRQAAQMLGAIDAKLVFGSGEWWRLFTAPLLHGGLSHLIGNCVVLGLIGFFLEPLVGPAWFGALFAIAAVGGDIGTMSQGQANLLSLGASGAITGLLAAALVCAGRMRNDERRARMQKYAGRILIYATLPAYLSASALSGHTDYAAHVGGALFGGVAGFLITLTWDRASGKPSFERVALGVGGGFAVLAGLGFLLAVLGSGAHATDSPLLIPYKEMPKDKNDAMAHSGDLIARYPADPRSHYFRGLYFAEQNDMPGAAEELRKALAAEDAHPDSVSPELDRGIHMMLALIIRAEGDVDAARAMAKESCAASPGSDEMLQLLKRMKVCS